MGISIPPMGHAKKGGYSPRPNTSDHHVHQLSYVNFINSYPLPKISCAVDKNIVVKINANCLDDFVLHVFYEDVNRLLGKDHLFKQSILLIKAWWLYESRTYNGFKMMKHVNEAMLLALIFAVVNVHHERLHTPLQVLAMFFHVYGALSWEDVLIGPVGPVPRNEYRPYTASTYPSSMLVSYNQITGYYVNYLKDSIGSRQGGTQKEQQFAPGSLGGMINEQSGNSRMCTIPGGQTTHTFVGIVVVVHPLVPGMNMIGKWGRTPQAKRVVQIINMSAKSLQRLFMGLQREISRPQRMQRQPPSIHLESTSVGMLNSFFGLSWARFGQGWRPDVWDRFDEPSYVDALSDVNSAWAIPSEALHVDLYELHQCMDYCLLILQEEVTEGGVISLAHHILAEKGAIPAGEVGKLLQEATSLPHLSKILKEKYGGLKRFLERHSDVFYISNDHPFNPCVDIRDRTEESEVENAVRISCRGTETSGESCGGSNKCMK